MANNPRYKGILTKTKTLYMPLKKISTKMSHSLTNKIFKKNLFPKKNSIIFNINSEYFEKFKILDGEDRIVLKNDVKNIISDIFKESQQLVPIDKRYVNTAFHLNKNLSHRVYSRENVETFTKSYNVEVLRTTFTKNSISPYSGKTITKRVESKSIERDLGWYTGREAEFLKSFFREPTRKKRYTLFYDGDSILFVHGRMGNRISTKLEGIGFNAKPFARNLKELGDLGFRPAPQNQLAGGNQELRKGGKIVDMGFGIQYSAFDLSKRRPSGFDYSMIQHENRFFEHLAGKQYHFLSDPVRKNKQKFVNAFKDALTKKIKR